MTKTNKTIGLPLSGEAGWPLDQGPEWRGGDAVRRNWWHAKAELSLDLFNGRGRQQGHDLAIDRALATVRSSPQLMLDASGTYQAFPVNTLACLAGVGAQIGGQVTNHLPWSAQFDSTNWAKQAGTGVTPGVALAPDGTMSACKLVEPVGLGVLAQIFQSMTAQNATTYTYGVFAKKCERKWVSIATQSGFAANVRAWFDVDAGVVGSKLAGVTSARMIALGKGWYYCYVVFTSASSGGGSRPVYVTSVDADGAVSQTGDGSSGLFIWGAQVETGPFPTAYIPTTGAPATRYASDVSAIQSGGKPFAGWASAGLDTEFSVGVGLTFTHLGDGVTRRAVTIGSDAGNRFSVGLSAGNVPFANITNAGASLMHLDETALSVPGKVGIAMRFKNGFYRLAITAGGITTTRVSVASIARPECSALKLGAHFGTLDPLNDIVRKLEIYRPGMTDTEIDTESARLSI